MDKEGEGVKIHLTSALTFPSTRLGAFYADDRVWVDADESSRALVHGTETSYAEQLELDLWALKRKDV